ncbi:MAG: NAD-dependent succinate-semialdehyde dehydrogenase [Pseudomonadota bacterium]
MKLKDPRLFRQQCFINGQWRNAEDGKTLAISNPASGETVGTVPSVDVTETREAIDAAGTAFPLWRAQTARQRAHLLRRWSELMMENQEDLAVLMTVEQGKPLTESRSEIAYAASFLEWFAEEGKRVYGDTIPSPFSDRRIIVTKEPIGVCAAITPWNFPSAMLTRKAGPALAAGCTLVIKPAEQTPFSAIALCVLAERAGFPKGVINLVTGVPEVIGGELTGNSLVRKLTFTGSTEVGRLLMRQCADTVKRISLELGGNAPFIVFGDADLDAAVTGAMASKFRNSGQTCVCANRFLVQDEVYNLFAEKLTRAVQLLKVGNGLEPDCQQGPLMDRNAVEKVEEYIADATSQGAKIVLGGKRHPLGGTFFEPTILTNVTRNMRVAKEEIFGPVAPLFRFTSERDAIELANATEYGLAAYLYTRDVGRVCRVSEALEYGMIGINEGAISMEVIPFGGMKQSGIGREGSKYGIEEFLELKYLCLGGIEARS